MIQWDSMRFNGDSMVIQWDFNGILMGFNGDSMVIQWDFNGILMGFNGDLMGFNEI